MKFGAVTVLNRICITLLLGVSQSTFAINFECLIEPSQMIELASPATGQLAAVMVKRGDNIKKGQVVAKLESDAEEAALQLAKFKSEQQGPLLLTKTKMDFAERKFNRFQEMSAANLMPLQEKETAEAEFLQAKAEFLTAQENLQQAALEYAQQKGNMKLRVLKSPVDGVVVEQISFVGEVVQPGSEKKSVFKIAQLNPLRIRAILPAKEFGKVKVGMPAVIKIDQLQVDNLKAKIKSIDKLIDAASASFVVIMDLPNTQQKIPSGLRCSGSVAN
jgi:RND family efflux transporter MFP subunit